ncbi:MAG: hypothetical protein RL523_80 [Actinomycetota bacterium]|jgi:hypothetical protein
MSTRREISVHPGLTPAQITSYLIENPGAASMRMAADG